ncbi:HEPN-associated N-terminal domain-containing protein [uncultured Brachyspira sp.]|uniref:HEPN-associated N-terminal domain-containing protein n=1 Tax=uncultured Brachyspira sp. TaxID=221953 RepID=UPI00262EDF8D|nr:HEPN-associated N-terminal domain-containing protein [uncultured Brachyspira sp.]
MGYRKNIMIEQGERGYGEVPNKYVCYKCFKEDGIRNYIKNNGERYTCSYCKQQYKAVHLEKIIKHIIDSLHSEWKDPVNNSPYESKEGGYINNYLYDTYDLLLYEEPINVNDIELFNDIVNAITQELWARDFAVPFEDEELKYEWDSFIKYVQHRMRFGVFCKDKILYPIKEIVHIIEKLNMETIMQPIKIYRVRGSKDKSDFSDAKKMGTVPPKDAIQANRMSPAGIAMFYGAFNKKTALSEIDYGNINYVHYATFVPSREMVLIDFSKKMVIPSIYDEKSGKLKKYYRFMDSYINDFRKPINRDGSEHIGYIPTQIITEYLRYNYKINGESIDGIIYNSSVCNNGKAIVLFVDNKNCINENNIDIISNESNLYLKMVDYKIKKITHKV